MRVFRSPYCYTTSLPSKVTADGWGWGVGGGGYQSSKRTFIKWDLQYSTRPSLLLKDSDVVFNILKLRMPA